MSSIGIAKHDAIPQDPQEVTPRLLADNIGALDGEGEWLYGVSNATHDNTRRAGFAAEGVIEYANRVGTFDEDIETVISDMFGDLRHLCDLVGADFGELVDRGYFHYAAEKVGD